MKYLCKKVFINNDNIKHLKKGEWYTIDNHGEENFYIESLNTHFAGKFDSYFYTLDELRELEINKILNEM